MKGVYKHTSHYSYSRSIKAHYELNRWHRHLSAIATHACHLANYMYSVFFEEDVVTISGDLVSEEFASSVS